MALYIGLLREGPGSDYGVDFPDFPGCITAARTQQEAREFAAEALALHIEGMIADGDEIPLPSSLDQVMENPENRDAVVVVIEAHVI